MTCTTFLELNVVRNVDVKGVSQNQYLNFYNLFCACLIFPVILLLNKTDYCIFFYFNFSGILVEI